MGGTEALFNGVVIGVGVLMASYAMFGWPDPRALARVLPHHAPPEPPHRRFEDLVTRARVLGPRVRSAQPGMRFAKLEGMRQGYDAVLGELSDELGIVHLLGVIPPGRALDAERARVEGRIERAGVDLGLPLL